jgi:hypothetical protein
MLMDRGRRTVYGKDHKFNQIRTPQDFAKLPIQPYESLYPYVERALKGESNILWPGRVQWFAKSSGTTNDRSKFIPITWESLHYTHVRGGKDLTATYLLSHANSKVFSGKSLGIGGSHEIGRYGAHARTGDLSAVLIQNLPFIYDKMRAPSRQIALLGDWEQKLELMARETIHDNITSIMGVPTWTQVLAERILQLTGKNHLHEVWPNLELFYHGGIAFGPYRERFQQLMPAYGMNFMEVYNASEGFIAFQNEQSSRDLWLQVDHGIYYEFLPVDGGPGAEAVPLEGVQTGVNYALVISTVSGLWRYLIGDTVRFTSTDPYKLMITGRTRHFINAFGEELMVENADAALAKVCAATGAIVRDYTAGPRYLRAGQSGAHEWIIEFQVPPADVRQFGRELDVELRKLNGDYDAKRSHDIILAPLILHHAPEGTFYRWMKSRGKLGGQNKVPRLSNERDYLDGLLAEIYAAPQPR